jgi:hypothetical protein
MNPSMFAQIRKVDEQKRLVFGRLAEEKVDKADEIMDYASSKPHFKKWSEDVAKDTGGQSMGNLRAMHGKVAAGKFVAVDFNDAEKAIDVCAKVVDDNEWKKVLEGVYTGFSIGGSYVGDKKVEKADGRDVTRYTARPTEGSLVDRPCMHGAKFFEVQKADGSLQKVDFVEDDADVTVNGTAEEVAALGKMMNEHGLTLADLLEKAVPAFVDAKKKGDGKEPAPKEGEDEPKTGKDAYAPPGDGKTPAPKEGEADPAAKDPAEDTPEAIAAKEAAAAEAKKAEEAADLAKAEELAAKLGMKLAKVDPAPTEVEALQKMVTDAVAAASEPLQKALIEATKKIEKLEAQPAPSTIKLRAVSKSDDVVHDEAAVQAKEIVEKATAPIVDAMGDKHEAAGLIKGLHAFGGQPLRKPTV